MKIILSYFCGDHIRGDQTLPIRHLGLFYIERHHQCCNVASDITLIKLLRILS